MLKLYINIGMNTCSSIMLFTNNCPMFRRIKGHQDTTQSRDPDLLYQWVCHWKLNFNPEKCSVLTTTKRKSPVTAENSMLAVYHNIPYLGAEIAQDLDPQANFARHFINRLSMFYQAHYHQMACTILPYIPMTQSRM